MDRFTVVGVLGFCCEPYWDSRNQRPSVALGKILSPLSSYSSSHHLEVCFVHTSGWCFYMQCWSLLIKLPDVFISSRVTNYINIEYLLPFDWGNCHSCINPIIYGVYYFSERNSAMTGQGNNHRWSSAAEQELQLSCSRGLMYTASLLTSRGANGQTRLSSILYRDRVVSG